MTNKTLLPIICQRIRPGSIIFSDCWKAYSKLNTLQYEHKTVNHKYNFVDPTTYAHPPKILKICGGKLKGIYHLPIHVMTSYTYTLVNICGEIVKIAVVTYLLNS